MTGAATTAWTRPESDQERTAILAAADRLLNGKPTASTGRLSVVQLAIEAGVKYWVVAQKHTDIRDHFQALVTEAKHTAPQAFAEPTAAEQARLDRQRLTEHCAGLEELVSTYAQVIHELTIENQALREQVAGKARNVVPLRRERTH